MQLETDLIPALSPNGGIALDRPITFSPFRTDAINRVSAFLMRSPNGELFCIALAQICTLLQFGQVPFSQNNGAEGQSL